MKGNSHNLFKMSAKRRRGKEQIKAEKREAEMKQRDITEKLQMIDQMNNMIAEQEAQLQQKDQDNQLFHDMFRTGLLKTDETGTISVVKSEKEQQRIAQGFMDSHLGDPGSKSKEQVNFEVIQDSRKQPGHK